MIVKDRIRTCASEDTASTAEIAGPPVNHSGTLTEMYVFCLKQASYACGRGSAECGWGAWLRSYRTDNRISWRYA
jgi:hypothetical protein